MKLLSVLLFVCIPGLSYSQIKNLDELMNIYYSSYDSVKALLNECWMDRFYESYGAINAYCSGPYEEQALRVIKSDSSGIGFLDFECQELTYQKILLQFSKYNLQDVSSNENKYNHYYSNGFVNLTIAKHPKLKTYTLYMIHSGDGKFLSCEFDKRYVENKRKKEKERTRSK